MRATNVAFIGALVYRVPALLGLLEEHLEEQNGEVLPHVFMADVTRWLVERLLSEGSSDVNLHAILSFMGQAFDSGWEELQELLAVSFLENLPGPGEPGYEIRAMLGPVMQQELRKLG